MHFPLNIFSAFYKISQFQQYIFKMCAHTKQNFTTYFTLKIFFNFNLLQNK